MRFIVVVNCNKAVNYNLKQTIYNDKVGTYTAK